MTALLQDIRDRNLLSAYPKHGYAYNSQNVKLLWFPIVSLVNSTKVICERNGATITVKHEDLQLPIYLYENLRRIAIVLKEIHEIARRQAIIPFGNNDLELLDYQVKSMEMLPIFVDMAFIYLRRFADRFSETIRPILFTKYNIVPVEYKNYGNLSTNQI